MHLFHYKEGRLYGESVAIDEIVKALGTPLYVYSLGTVLDHFCKLRDAFAPANPLICYSVKANANPDIISHLARGGCGADVVSGGEIYRCIEAGVPPDRIVYAGVGKTEEEMAYALRQGILMFNVESLEEAKALDGVATRLGCRARVAFRVNPDIDPHTHEKITTGKKENKFGIPAETLLAAVPEINALQGLEWVGLHCHIGSQIAEVGPFLAAVDALKAFAAKLRASGVGITTFNLGGGCAIEYGKNKAFTAVELARSLLPRLTGEPYRLIMEPGRFIVGNAGILVTQVLYRKKGDAKNFLVVDAAMTDLIRPTLYDAYHQILPVVEPDRPEREKVDVVGPVCESGDFLAKDREMARVASGELLAVFGAGAYGYSMSSNYNGRLRAAEVLIRGDQWTLSRRRETRRDLISLDALEAPFVKMGATGNDFVVVDATAIAEILDLSGFARRICSRRFGASSDGLLYLAPSEKADFRMRIFNLDGSEAEMCGNGARCACAYAFKRGWCHRDMTFEALDGIHRGRVDDGKVAISLNVVGEHRLDQTVRVDGQDLVVHFFNSGVPHAVTFWDDVQRVDAAVLGRKIRWHEAFQPAGANVNFVQVRDPGHLIVRTYERGVEGETLACGTGVVASSLVSALLGKTRAPVMATTSGGGILTVSFQILSGQPSDVFLEGEAEELFSGTMKGEIC